MHICMYKTNALPTLTTRHCSIQNIHSTSVSLFSTLSSPVPHLHHHRPITQQTPTAPIQSTTKKTPNPNPNPNLNLNLNPQPQPQNPTPTNIHKRTKPTHHPPSPQKQCSGRALIASTSPLPPTLNPLTLRQAPICRPDMPPQSFSLILPPGAASLVRRGSRGEGCARGYSERGGKGREGSTADEVRRWGACTITRPLCQRAGSQGILIGNVCAKSTHQPPSPQSSAQAGHRVDVSPPPGPIPVGRWAAPMIVSVRLLFGFYPDATRAVERR